MMSFRSERDMKGNDIAFFIKFRQKWFVIESLEFIIRLNVVGQNVTAQTIQNLNHDGTNLSGANNSDRFSGKIEANKPIQGKITFSYSRIRTVSFSI